MSARTVVYLSPSVTLFGARQVLLALVRELDRDRYTPAAVVLDEGPLTEALRAEGIPVEVVRIGPWRKAKTWPFIPWRLWRIARFCRSVGAEILHANDFWATPWALAAARFAGRPTVVASVHNRPGRSRLRRYKLHRAAMLHVISKAVQSEFDHWPDRDERTRLIYSGVDLAPFESAQPGEFRKSESIPRGAFLVTVPAHISRRKNQLMLIEALGLLTDASPRIEVALVGGSKEDDYLAEIRRRADELGVADRLHVVGFRRDMGAVYAESDLVALVSAEEGLGLVAAEGMAAGRAVVGTRVGGIPEVVADGETGVLVDEGDVGSLAEAVRRLAGDAELRRGLAVSGRGRALELFSARKMAGKMMELYDAAMASGRASQ